MFPPALCKQDASLAHWPGQDACLLFLGRSPLEFNWSMYLTPISIWRDRAQLQETQRRYILISQWQGKTFASSDIEEVVGSWNLYIEYRSHFIDIANTY